MTKVYLDELNAALSFSTFSTLEQDSKDATSTGNSIKSFVEGSSAILTGEQWDKVRSKLGVYDQALASRVEVALHLSDAIKKALTILKNYMSPYKCLDTSKLEEYKNERKICFDSKQNLEQMLTETVTVSYKKSDGSTGYTTKLAYDSSYIKSQIFLAEQTLAELDKLIEKVEGLPAKYAEAENILKAAFDEISTFKNKVTAITPSGKYSYQK